MSEKPLIEKVILSSGTKSATFKEGTKVLMIVNLSEKIILNKFYSKFNVIKSILVY